MNNNRLSTLSPLAKARGLGNVHDRTELLTKIPLPPPLKRGRGGRQKSFYLNHLIMSIETMENFLLFLSKDSCLKAGVLKKEQNLFILTVLLLKRLNHRETVLSFQYQISESSLVKYRREMESITIINYVYLEI